MIADIALVWLGGAIALTLLAALAGRGQGPRRPAIMYAYHLLWPIMLVLALFVKDDQ